MHGENRTEQHWWRLLTLASWHGVMVHGKNKNGVCTWSWINLLGVGGVW